MVKEWVKYIIWVGGATLWATICFIIPDFADNPIGNVRALASVIAYIFSVSIFHFFLLYLIGANKYICAGVLPIYAIAGAICSYYRYFYHVSITPLLLDATIHTTVQEASGVISIWLILWVLLCLSVGIGFCYLRFHQFNQRVPLWSVLILIVLGCGYYFAIPRLREGLNTRYPLNVLHSTIECIKNSHKVATVRTTPKYERENIPDSLTVIVVLGEAVRADHLQLNGYKRETTPKLMRRKNIVSLPNIYSPYTNTTSSIPHIITRADSAHADYAYTEHSFVTIFRQEHFNTVWLSNQDLAEALYDFLLEPDTVIYTKAAIQQSLYGKWLDGELLPIFEESLNHPQQLIILHTVGSHWLYDTHVTDDFFVFHPTISNRDVRLNTIEQIVNSYDNSIVYMDSFLDTIIKKIENRPAILLYLSDHGESLGEGGRFLHAQEDAEEEKRPAAIIWYSDQYEYLFPQKVAALKSNHLNQYRTDYLYHSVLSAAGIEISGENSGLDIFR